MQFDPVVQLPHIPKGTIIRLGVCTAGESVVSHLQFMAAPSPTRLLPLWSNRLLSLMSPEGGRESESFLTSVSIGPRVLPDLHWQERSVPNESKRGCQIGNTGDTLLRKQTAKGVNVDIWIEHAGKGADLATFLTHSFRDGGHTGKSMTMVFTSTSGLLL